MEDYLTDYVNDLLHCDEILTNKLIDLENGNSDTTFYLLSNSQDECFYSIILNLIKERIGKPGNVALKGSALRNDMEQIVGESISSFRWSSANGVVDPNRLNSFINFAYKELSYKGNNPIFLSIGAIKWKVAYGKEDIKTIVSPLLIFPIRLVRATTLSPVCIEFVNQDAYINPCLLVKLQRELNAPVVSSFPYINEGLDEPINLDILNDGKEYFDKVKEYILSCNSNDDKSIFEFNPNVIAISSYNHSDICMYYDIKQNKDKMLSSPLIYRMFNKCSPEPKKEIDKIPVNVLNIDSIQLEMIAQAISGDSMVIKGPPGTGKTVTIVNTIASLLAEGKNVLVSSKKLAALSEIYAKMPENLRRFMLLLESESEAKAASISPRTIKKDLKEELEYIKKYNQNSNAVIDCMHLKNHSSDVKQKILNYATTFFLDKKTLGESLYSAIDHYFVNDTIPTIDVFKDSSIEKFDRAVKDKILEIIKEFDGYYYPLTDGYKISYDHNPFYGISNKQDIDVITDIYKDASKTIFEIKDIYLDILNNHNIDLNNINLRNIYDVCLYGDSSLDLFNTYKNLLDDEKIQKLNTLLNQYLDNDLTIISNVNNDISEEQLNNCYSLLSKDKTLLDMDFNFIDKIYASSSFLGSIKDILKDENIKALSTIFGEIENIYVKKNNHFNNFRNTYKKDLSNKDLDYIYASYKPLKKCIDENKAPSKIALLLKQRLKKLKEFSYLSDVNDIDLINGVNEYFLMLHCDEEVETWIQRIYKIFKEEVNKQDISAIRDILTFTKDEYSISKVLSFVSNNYDDIKQYYTLALSENFDKNITISSLLSIYKALSDKLALDNALKEIVKEKTEQDSVSLLHMFISYYALKKAINDEDVTPIVKLISSEEYAPKLVSSISGLFNLFNSLLDIDVKNFYSTNSNLLTIPDLDDFVLYSKDRNIINSAAKVQYYLSTDNEVLNLRLIVDSFSLLSYKQRSSYRLTEVIEQSLYKKAIDHNINKMGVMNSDAAHEVKKLFDDVYETDQKILALNRKIIENKIVGRTNMEDPDLMFISHENDTKTLRRLFKNYSKGITKLKKCIIASPSTISLLLKNDDYMFDVAIVDEASQLEPVCLLPIAYRSKQIIVVGDEWQMPPIEHFKVKNKSRIDSYDEELIPESSALSLLLANESFITYTLECHYRSKTESLIKFSQERFYDNMHTFPAPLPKREGLGFNDIYVEDASSEGGVNHKEVQVVLDNIRKHYDTYLVDGYLTESLGVVTFGLKQKEAILIAIKKDTELTSKIQESLKNKKEDDTDDKVIFFRTIEDVQGQEADHLILSITYGVDKSGNKVNRFGELNRDKLGQCIFNVAVSRARNSITVIHSIKAEDIDDSFESKVSYIKDYLMISNEFSQSGKNQFVSEETKNGFISSVGKYIASLGIDELRIVYNYGCTRGSIKMPIAILNEDMTKALGGFWIEKHRDAQYNYFDYNIHYYKVLSDINGWKLHRMFIYDWYTNQEYEKEQIKKFVALINGGN